MSTRGWRDGYKAPRGRIDTRPQNDPAVQAGLRNIHRDMRGNVIGAVTPEGERLGTRQQTRIEAGGWRGGSATPRLDAGPQTPGLDSNPRQAAPPNNLQQRQALFADMQKTGAGGLTPEMSQRAQKLGIDQAGWRRGVAKLSPAPASIASPTAPVMASVAPAAAPVKLTRTPYPVAPAVAPVSPMVEQATALRDVGRMMAARKPVEMAGPPVSAKPPMSFATAPMVNPQPVATSPAPLLTAPATASPAKITRTPAPAQLTDKYPVTFKPAPTAADSVATAKQLISNDVAAGLSRKNRIQAAKDAVTIPSWQNDTILGSVNRGIQRYSKNWIK